MSLTNPVQLQQQWRDLVKIKFFTLSLNQNIKHFVFMFDNYFTVSPNLNILYTLKVHKVNGSCDNCSFKHSIW